MVPLAFVAAGGYIIWFPDIMYVLYVYMIVLVLVCIENGFIFAFVDDMKSLLFHWPGAEISP